MADYSAFTNILLSWLINPLIWLVIIGVILFMAFGILKIRKILKLQFKNSIELVDMGDNRFSLNHFKTGWFGRKTMFMGLIDYGEEVLKNQWGEVIHDFSTEDYVEINGKRDIICYRDPLRQNMLVPIHRLNVLNRELVAEIAPADYTNTAIEIVNDATKETRDWKQQLYTWMVIGGVVIFALVSIIVITQMVQKGQKEAADLLLKAGTTCMENAKTVCSTIASTASGQAP